MEINKPFQEVVVSKYNRITSRTSKFRQHWCHRCDSKIVAESQRCPNCGYRSEERRIKNFGLHD